MISSVEFSPDGSTIVSQSVNKTIRLWDASTGIEITSVTLSESPDGSKIISKSHHDDVIRVWDARTGRPYVAADDTSNAMDEPMIGEWFTNFNTGRYMGALPVGASFYHGKIRGSTYVGWTSEYKLAIIHFPEL